MVRLVSLSPILLSMTSRPAKNILIPRDRSLAAARALAGGGLRKTTYTRYMSAVQLFITFLLDNRLHPIVLDDLDEYLFEYMLDLFLDHRSFNLASSTLYGIYTIVPAWRSIGGGLAMSAQLLRAWSRAEPAISHPPITYETTCAIAVSMLKVGTRQWCAYAIACLVAFDAYLRIGELVNLTVGDVAAPGDARLDSAYTNYALRLGVTKTGRNQFVYLDSLVVGSLLQLLCAGKRPTDRVFGFEAAAFRGAMKQAAASIGVGHCGFLPHSFRHGGASRDFMLNRRSLEQIMFRGRWKALESARTYIQCGQALLLLNRIPTDVHSAGAAFSMCIGDLVRYWWNVSSSRTAIPTTSATST